MEASEYEMTMPDGTALFYRAWEPSQPTNKALVLFHRGHEHSGRFQDVVEQFDLDGATVFAWDARGHGRSPGQRGYTPSFATTAHDMHHFIRGLSERHGISVENMVAVGHSVGAVALAAWVHDYAPPLSGLVLVTPAFRVRLYVPLAIPGLRALQGITGGRRMYLKSYVKSRMLTHDEDQARAYDNDELISRSIAVNVLLELHDTASRLIDDAATIQTPTLLLVAGSDWVVVNTVQRRFFQRLGAERKRIRTLPGRYHDLMHERDREPVIEEIQSFFNDCVSGRTVAPATQDADRYGPTIDEYDALNQRQPLWSPKGAWFGLQRLLMRSMGQLSDGIRLGWQTGFDSGQSLDYVYNNQPSGRLASLGRLIDRQYLNAPGWRGIRERKTLLQDQLRTAIQNSHVPDCPVRILDLAAGGGRYALEVAADFPDDAISLTLRDNVRANLEAARALASSLGVNDVGFQVADAFNEREINDIDPAPDIVIVSGLYELIPENTGVAASLRGIAGVLSAGGQLIYTGQPWHPQLEMIARVLPNREGRSWVMRRRSQYELDGLVTGAGFTKREQTIDAHGIFTVSRAVR